MLDYMVMEAVAIKVQKLDREAQEKAEEEQARNEFKSDFSSLDKFR